MFVEANCWVSRRHLARDGRHLNRESVSRLSSLFGALIPASLRVMEDSVASGVPGPGLSSTPGGELGVGLRAGVGKRADRSLCFAH
ncbi:hypothetical protein J6590_000807 [Homalodisca vitripennis]|nr:hypothetical protein J6590_000807 [Homalodisca vitripennis]